MKNLKVALFTEIRAKIHIGKKETFSASTGATQYKSDHQKGGQEPLQPHSWFKYSGSCGQLGQTVEDWGAQSLPPEQ